MVLKFFLVYVGAFLAGAVALLLVAKNFAPGLAMNTKKPVILGSVSAIIASGAAYLSLLFTDHLFMTFWAFAGIFLLFGIIHLLFFHKRFFYPSAQEGGKTIVGELLFMLALVFFIIIVFLSLVFFLKNKEFLFFPMLTSMITFFIPLSVYYCFDAAYRIPKAGSLCGITRCTNRLNCRMNSQMKRYWSSLLKPVNKERIPVKRISGPKAPRP
ncbi:MAG: hypothetical protein IPI66_07510 [Chitinophagaceae bacterium]|nr:hypothetical protein [Chitinophagaceae bacterium]